MGAIDELRKVEAERAPADLIRRSGRHEVVVVTAAAAIYFGVRELVEGSTSTALRNATRIRSLQGRLGLNIEDQAQDFAVDHAALRALGNFSYVWLHWPLIVGALVLLFRLDWRRYRQLRDAMFWSGGVGIVSFAVFPVAPPRFLSGFVGTVSDDQRRLHVPFPMEWANRYAAFPSFHVGWTLIASIAVAGLLPNRWLRGLALVPAMLVAVSVVTTGNHYVVDALAGATIALGAYLALRILR